ncbi:electron transport complex, RnfABCDGE type, C subunit [Nitrosococcus halophilus Nc 4]|uniref:Ion-translocating oxidoreductase complex subunit C n=1 Tax=Nitrosococcus halophilus (strain Nc4) TaxID=472759 RepID=D5BXD2_NITHN|nr:electron transport complex subunit RsxC [Nitrosococcus halophilus]ADE15815.1 electron transport complex, RnfABCDGE type, C subunit [Nitrosococcus halophilus Nc 4]
MKKRRLWSFPGGLKLPDHKSPSTQAPIAPAALPKQLVLPLQQHIGEPAEPVVNLGERVLKGQVIATAQGYLSAPVHASSSGQVVAIDNLPIPHPSGLNAPCIVIETDGEDAWSERQRVENYQQLDPSQLRNLIRQAGIVGLGGAGFPTFIKLNPGPEPRVETLILNGAECEPYITCDDLLMRERAEEIIQGIRIMGHALHVHHCLIGIEDNKSEAYRALAAAATEGIEVVSIPTRYPTGGEKQLIKVLTGQEVPSNGLPIDVGVVCHNVGTAVAVHRAINVGEPLISRIVTVTGSAVARPRNLEVLLGTPIRHLLTQCDTDIDRIDRLIMGGPMMGFTLHHDAAPVIKTTNCLLAGLQERVRQPPVMPCIRCGACGEVCPVQLLPQQLYWHARAKELDKLQDYHLFDCIECGCCDYVCPSHIPLVHYYRYAKSEIWAQEQEREKADLARQRHEFRRQRREREQQERAARQQAKKAAVAPSASKTDKQAAIQAAVERARAKRTAQNKAVDETPPSQ